MKPLQLRDAATLEMGEAARWYEEQREGLGRDFIAETERAVGPCYSPRRERATQRG